MSNKIHKLYSDFTYYQKMSFVDDVVPDLYYNAEPEEFKEPFATLLQNLKTAWDELEESLYDTGWNIPPSLSSSSSYSSYRSYAQADLGSANSSPTVPGPNNQSTLTSIQQLYEDTTALHDSIEFEGEANAAHF